MREARGLAGGMLVLTLAMGMAIVWSMAEEPASKAEVRLGGLDTGAP